MGRRDYRHREPKKTKKDAKKISSPSVVPPPMTVEVVKKQRKERKEEQQLQQEGFGPSGKNDFKLSCPVIRYLAIFVLLFIVIRVFGTISF